jgi:hypothetical protein
VDLNGWFNSETTVEVEYTREYEPYLVYRRPVLAEFPPEFMGRGFNKASWLFMLHAIGYVVVVAAAAAAVAACVRCFSCRGSHLSGKPGR